MGKAVANMYQGGENNVLTVLAPAKVNLTLEVLGERPDGFHEIRSVIQTINLYDSLRFELGQNIEFRCDSRDWIAEESLVSRAISLLQETTGCSRGAIIEIDKRIPMVSGLGGDSSDAAAVLRGLNKLWELGLSLAELVGLASRLGSDVPFFLYGGTALLKGRGEIITPLPSLPNMWVVLVVPPVPRMLRKTAQLYARLKPSHYTRGEFTERLVAELTGAAQSAPSVLFNTFENIAFARSSELKVYQEHLLKVGAGSIHLAGSGPTLFTLIRDKSQAEELLIRCQQQGLECYLAETLASIEVIK
jgi:4-diphosphocytidyl-2-C-methyl-D-erythritol kinase